MAHHYSLILFVLIISVCFGQFSIQDTKQSLCLYSGSTNTVLKPLQLFNTDCPKNTSYCMNTIYKYSNFQYNGISALKPQLGEVTAFLAQSEDGSVDMVVLLNANVAVTSQVQLNITGADPVPILLYDDPTTTGKNTDFWNWNQTTNTGKFSWTTQPGYTDGVVIGHINFVDQYCVSASFTQAAGAINKVSILSGSTKNVSRVLSTPYTSGANFQFCQYPVTTTTYQNATCPGAKDGSASIAINFGPSNVNYRWFDSSNNLVSSSASATGLGAGTYQVFLNDTNNANGCNANRQVVISDHTLNGAFVTTTPFACSTKGTASATPNGGASGFSYSWFKAGATSSFATGTKVTGLDQGNYFVRVTDSCGSSADTTFTIVTSGCCGDSICQANEGCTSTTSCAADCGACCPAGTTVDGDSCTVCPPGSRNNAAQSTSCTPCPANTFNAGGNDTCAPCPANYFSTAGSGKCARCPAGQVRDTSDSSCSACAAGSYAPPCDDSSCTACPAGSVSNASGATFCTSCSAGTFAAAGQTSCSPCAVGSYSSSGASSCTACPSGTTTPAAGATHLLACN